MLTALSTAIWLQYNVYLFVVNSLIYIRNYYDSG